MEASSSRYFTWRCTRTCLASRIGPKRQLAGIVVIEGKWTTCFLTQSGRPALVSAIKTTCFQRCQERDRDEIVAVEIGRSKSPGSSTGRQRAAELTISLRIAHQDQTRSFHGVHYSASGCHNFAGAGMPRSYKTYPNNKTAKPSSPGIQVSIGRGFLVRAGDSKVFFPTVKMTSIGTMPEKGKHPALRQKCMWGIVLNVVRNERIKY